MSVNVLPVRNRELLRRCRRGPRPDHKMLSSERKNVHRRIGIPIQFGATCTGMPPVTEIFFDDGATS